MSAKVLQKGTDVDKCGDEFFFSDDSQADSIGYNEEAPMMMDDFHKRLIDIDDEMGTDELEGLKFLCRDHIAVSKLDKAEMPIDIFEHMKKAMLIDVNNVDFLLECLGRIHRFDLVRKLGFDDIEAVRTALPTFQKILPLRVLLMDLSDDLDDADIDKIRFLLKSRIKKKILNERQSVLQLFIYMEQEGLLGPTKLDVLTSLMVSIKRPELVERVRQLDGQKPRKPTPSNMPRIPSNPQNFAQGQNGLQDNPDRFANGDIRGPPEPYYERVAPLGTSESPTEILNRLPDQAPSAGTLTVSSSESEISSGPQGNSVIPEPIVLQICEDLKTRFEDLRVELGFSIDQMQELEAHFSSPSLKTRRLLEAWMNSKSDRGQISSELYCVLGKLDFKTIAEVLKQWLINIDKGQGQTSRLNAEGQVARQRSAEYQPAGPPENNITMSYREAKPTVPLNPTANLGTTNPVGEVQIMDVNNLQHMDVTQLQQLIINGQQVQGNTGAPNDQNTVLQQFVSQNMGQGHVGRNLVAPGNMVAPGNLGQPQMVLAPTNQGHVSRNVAAPAIQGQGQMVVAPGNQGQGHVSQQIPADQGKQRMSEMQTPSRKTGPLEMATYDMTHKPRGWCVIINNEKFHVENAEGSQIPERKGTDKDAEGLQHIFHKLGFIVRRFNNLSDTQMMQKLVDLAHNVDHKNFDCVICCILTHGVLNHLYGANGQMLSIKDLTATFQSNRCPSLAGKPKLFFLQACQGRDKMEGSEIQRDAGQFDDLQTDTLPKEMIPNEADFLLGYATVPGYVSFRSPNHGSWYICKLCELLEKFSDRHDLLSILTEVNRQVSSADANMDGGLYKQVPAPLFTLRKKLFLKKCPLDEQ